MVTPRVMKAGYIQYRLCDNKRHMWRLSHRLAWEAFKGQIPEGMQINHKNGVKADNRLVNLEVVTPSDNTAHKFRVLGHKPPNNPSRGEKNGSAKITGQDVIEIRQRCAAGESRKAIAKEFAITDISVGNIVRRKTWRHI